jgi:hypothetical protein
MTERGAGARGSACGHTTWEIVCPDDRVRGYPYHNLDDAKGDAELYTGGCGSRYEEPSEIELSQPPCPGGPHTVRQHAGEGVPGVPPALAAEYFATLRACGPTLEDDDEVAAVDADPEQPQGGAGTA